MSWREAITNDRIVVALAAIALLVAAVGEFCRRPGSAPAASWNAAAQAIAAARRNGDVVLLNNAGATDGLDVLQGFKLDPRLALPEPRGRVRRLWLVGWRSDEPAGLGPLVEEPLPFTAPESLTVRLYARPAGGLLWRAQDALGQAAVRANGKACRTPKAGGLRCGHLPDWMHVSPDQLVNGGEARNCLWAHPPKGNKPLTIRFANVPSGKLRFEHGLSDTAAASSNRSPVEVTLRWEGGSAKSKAGNRDGWVSSEHDVRGFLELEIKAAKDGQRHHCFKAAIR